MMIEMGLHRVDTQVMNMRKDDSLWINELLIREMRILPSEVLRQY